MTNTAQQVFNPSAPSMNENHLQITLNEARRNRYTKNKDRLHLVQPNTPELSKMSDKARMAARFNLPC